MMWALVGLFVMALAAMAAVVSGHRERAEHWQALVGRQVERNNLLSRALHDLVIAMEAWGREEDGVPEETVAYDRARALLGMLARPAEVQRWEVVHGSARERHVEAFVVTQRRDQWQATQPHNGAGFYWGATPREAVLGWARLAGWKDVEIRGPVVAQDGGSR